MAVRSLCTVVKSSSHLQQLEKLEQSNEDPEKDRGGEGGSDQFVDILLIGCDW